MLPMQRGSGNGELATKPQDNRDLCDALVCDNGAVERLCVMIVLVYVGREHHPRHKQGRERSGRETVEGTALTEVHQFLMSKSESSRQLRLA